MVFVGLSRQMVTGGGRLLSSNGWFTNWLRLACKLFLSISQNSELPVSGKIRIDYSANCKPIDRVRNGGVIRKCLHSWLDAVISIVWLLKICVLEHCYCHMAASSRRPCTVVRNRRNSAIP